MDIIAIVMGILYIITCLLWAVFVTRNNSLIRRSSLALQIYEFMANVLLCPIMILISDLQRDSLLDGFNKEKKEINHKHYIEKREIYDRAFIDALKSQAREDDGVLYIAPDVKLQDVINRRKSYFEYNAPK